MLYRNCLKGLVDFKSVRKRSLIAYCRLSFRKRGKATEKLLIDECIEEARRAVYVLQKNHDFTKSGQYEFDSMTLPKDTGQNVKEYMEEVYDPEMSRQEFARFQDVKPGNEGLHQQRLGPTHGPIQKMRLDGVRPNSTRAEAGDEDALGDDSDSPSNFKVRISDEDKVFRPPPPPMEGAGRSFRR